MDNLVEKFRDYIRQRKFQLEIFFIILPFWMLYTIYETYYDETTKDAVIHETEQIINYVGGNPKVVYKNQDKIMVFRAEIYIDAKDTNAIDKYKKYLVENGYIEKRKNRWDKGKYTVREKNDDGFIVLDLKYYKDEP